MSFLEKAELKSVMYQYQLEEVTEADDDIVFMSIEAATDEVKSYLRQNGRKDWQDGRPKYDVDAVFSKEGTERNALLLEITKNIAIWYLIRLCNVDMMFENIKDRYDRAVEWLKKVNKGDITLDLPLLAVDDTAIDANASQPFRFGSRTKFNHE